jgi:hypothetical protein
VDMLIALWRTLTPAGRSRLADGAPSNLARESGVASARVREDMDPHAAEMHFRVRGSEESSKSAGQGIDLVSEGGHQHGNVADVPRARRHVTKANVSKLT